MSDVFGSMLSGNVHALRWDSIAKLTDMPGVSEAMLPVGGWTHVQYITEKALVDEAADDRDGNNYVYGFVLRRSLHRFLLTSNRAEYVAAILHRARLLVSNPRVEVQKLVKQLTDNPDTYHLSAVYARIDAFGTSMRAMSMYGADLAGARLFRNLLDSITPYRTCLRDMRTGDDVVTVGSRGEISFHCRSASSLKSIDAALKFLSDRQLLAWGDNDEQH